VRLASLGGVGVSLVPVGFPGDSEHKTGINVRGGVRVNEELGGAGALLRACQSSDGSNSTVVGCVKRHASHNRGASATCKM
jgi:hypothetical protein